MEQHTFDVSSYAGQEIRVVFVYFTRFPTGGHTFAVDNIVVSPPAVFNPDQVDTDGDGIGDVCE